ncbi:MAG: nuclear transport factor 2 family protein [candidate division Zixibacteria bacterium]|nr:nuclear transport factor 2 family protein [candidate division Zixibacteria bacterium]
MQSQGKTRVGRLAAIALAALMASVSAVTTNAQKLELSILSTPITSFRTDRSADSGMVETSIALGAPLYIRLELTNNTAQPIELPQSVDPAGKLVGVFVVGPAGSTRPLHTRRWEVRDLDLKAKPLAPGKSIVHETFLYGVFADEKARTELEYLFPAPGSYQLFARYSSPEPTLTVESNRVTVRVGEPVPHWQALLSAGIVDQLEGRSRSQEESRRRRDSLSAIIAQSDGNPLAPMFIPPGTSSNSATARVSPATEQTIREVIDQFVSAWEAGDLQFCGNVLTEDFQSNGLMNRTHFQQMLSDGLDSLRGQGAQASIMARDIKVSSKDGDVESVFRLGLSTIEGGIVSEHAIAIVWKYSGGAWRMWRWNSLEP